MNKVNLRVMKAIRNSKGRFFETDQTIVVYDRNFNRTRRFSKTSISGVRIAAKNFGKTF